jgi:hypothetical protein
MVFITRQNVGPEPPINFSSKPIASHRAVDLAHLKEDQSRLVGIIVLQYQHVAGPRAREPLDMRH